MIQLAVEPDVCSGITTAPAAPVARGGIVSRRGLVARLTGAGRVTVVSAPAGSGKTFLLRSWVRIGLGSLSKGSGVLMRPRILFARR